jgi:hypothetical protein
VDFLVGIGMRGLWQPSVSTGFLMLVSTAARRLGQCQFTRP